MQNSQKDLDLLSTQSSSEIEFLQQVKECQQYLYRMEKLFFDIQKDSERERRSKSSQASLNHVSDAQPLQNKKLSHASKSSKEFKQNAKNKLQAENDSPLRFVVQVPNSILNSFRNNISSEKFSNLPFQYYEKKTDARKGFISFFRKLFKRNESKIIANTLDNAELLQLYKANVDSNIPESFQSSSVASNFAIETKNSNLSEFSENKNGCIDSNTNNNKQDIYKSQTLVFPITCNFNEKIAENSKPNFKIHHEIKSLNSKNIFSHCVKITRKLSNENGVHISNKSELHDENLDNEKINIEKEKLESTTLLECLMKTLIKTTEKLENFEKLEAFLDILSKQKLATESMHYLKSKSCRESRSIHHCKKCKWEQPKFKEKLSQQISRKQISKFNSHSSIANFSGNKEQYKIPAQSKSKHHQNDKQKKCFSSSILHYLICPSEKDH